MQWQQDMTRNSNRDERAMSWKILVPHWKDSRVLALGLNHKELGELVRTVKRVDTSLNSHEYDIVIFSNDAGLTELQECLARTTANSILVTLNSSEIRDKIRQSEWQCIGEYACMPPHRPRIFLPLASKKVRSAALNFHVPGSLIGRTYLRNAKWLNSIGITFHLRRVTVAFYSIESQMDHAGSLRDCVSQMIGWPVDEMVVYGGSESPASKISALALSADCHSQVVVKIGDTDEASAAIRNESATLSILAQSPLASVVPVLIAEHEWGPYSIQVQSYLPKRSRQCKSLTNAHMDFLSELSHIDRRRLPIHRTKEWRIISELPNSPVRKDVPGSIWHLASRILDCGIGEAPVECHMIHGDFTPWNIIYEDGCIFVYDWEDSSPVGVPLQDAFHFVYRQAALVGPWRVKSVLRLMREVGTALTRKSEIRCDIDYILGIWCVKEYIRRPSQQITELAAELNRAIHE